MSEQYRILLIEDSRTQAEHLCMRFEREGWRTAWAADAETALEEIAHALPDLIVVDYHLPGMRGDELCRQLRMNVDTREVPILMLTVEQTGAAELRGLESGADHYLAKSVDPDILLLRIRGLLRRSRAHASILGGQELLFSRARVLAMDASPTYLAYLAGELGAESYRLERAATACEGLERLRRERFDCVLVDLDMPEMDGIEACRRIRDTHGSIDDQVALLVTTAHQSKQEMTRALEAGADDFLPKSAGMGVLRARIRALLRRKLFQEENRRILEELNAKEVAAVRARAEKEAAEARAAWAEQLARTNRRLEDANRALKSTQDRYRAFYDLVGVGTAQVDAGTLLLTDVNDAFCRIAGYGREELLRMSFPELTHPDDRPGDRRLYEQLKAGELPAYSNEKRYVRKDGSVCWVRVEIAGIRGSDGDLACSIAIIQDITDRKAAEHQRDRVFEQLQEANALLDAMFNHAPVGLGFWDRELRFARVNDALARINGLPAEAHLGKTVAELLPNVEPKVMAAFRQVVDTGEPIINLEVSGETPAAPGVPRHWNVSVYPVRLNGAIAGAGAVCEEITERKRMEDAVRQAQKLESLGVLAGGIAHDFNNLLVGVLGNASLVLETMSYDDPDRRFLESIIRSSERAAELTRQLLAYAGKGQFVIEPVDLSALVRDTQDLIHASIPKAVNVRLELAAGLPEVHADASQLRQLLMNLIINGAEAVPEGAPGLVQIRTSAEDLDEKTIRSRFPAEHLAAGQYVHLEVSDNGCGMDAATQARIFDPFFTTKFTGRGLGLAAVSGIVRAHDGALSVHSEPGKGTTFEVLLPAAAREARPTAMEQQRQASDLRGSGTILVVDDEEFVRRMAEETLKRYGYEVMLAENGLRAVEVFEEHACRISAVLLDLAMPVLGGTDALRLLRQTRANLKVVLTSGYDEAEALRMFRDQGVAAFIQKPYTAARLAETMASVLRT